MDKFTIIVGILVALIFIFIGFIIYEYNRFSECKNKEHPTCPIFNCVLNDELPYGTLGNYCGNAAFRIDSKTNQKLCSGDVFVS